MTHIHEEQVGEDVQITEADVNAVIKSLKTGKAPGEDDIRPEISKAINMHDVRWLTRVCKVACRTGQAPKQWQTSVIIPIHKKGDKRKCTNYRGISLISVPVKVYAKCLEKKRREIVEPKLTDAQCGFRPGRSTMDEIFALQLIFEKSWEYAKEVNACFVDLEKAYDRIPRDKLWAVLLQYGIGGQLLPAIKSLYMHYEVCVRVKSAPTKPFKQGRAQKFEKEGGAIYCLHVSPENIGEDQKKGLHVFRRPVYPPKSSEDQKKNKVNASSVVLFPLFRSLQIYISLYFRGGRDGGPPPRYAPVSEQVWHYGKAAFFHLFCSLFIYIE